MHEAGQDGRNRPNPMTPVGDPNVGRLLDGRYLLASRIARGGMASVYEATDTRLDRTVAVKVMHPGMGDDEEFAARFVREARAAAKLSHPNVVAVYDQGDEDDTVFLVMELVSGHTLRDVITKESPMAPLRALALIEPVLSALASAHRAGLIHRDVKPENVLIADDGRVKVADFGLAKAVSANTQHTTKGVLIGTVAYLAPELVVEGRADARADVYAVGVLLYELLTGTKPHDGETPIQVAYKHVHNDVPPPSEVAPGLPEYVDALVARATARDRDSRPADASVMLHQVHRVSQALADGVREDPDLVQDLTPRRHGDTAPEQWDEEELAALSTPPPPLTSHTAPVSTNTTALRPLPPPERLQPAPLPPRPAAGRPRRRRGPLLLIVALVLALAVGGGAYWFGWARYTDTPGVIGMQQAAAEQKLEAAGLSVKFAEDAYSESVPEGEVIGSDPGPGDRVTKDGTVTVTVSLGKERYDVPPVANMLVDDAQDALLEVHLAFGELVEKYSEKVPEGTVIGALPKVGATLRPGTPVDLVVSKGQRPIKIGSWVGKPVERAKAALTKRGLVGNVVSSEYSDDVDKGDVISQDPSSGTLFRDGVVSFVVSKGPELIEVPSIRAYGVEAAQDALEDAGFKVVLAQVTDYLGFGLAVKTDPPSGSLAPKGSTITLYTI